MISEHTKDIDRYSASIGNLEMLSYFLHFQEIREFLRKKHRMSSQSMSVRTSCPIRVGIGSEL